MNKTAKHTPGPWRIAPDSDDRLIQAEYRTANDEGFITVAQVVQAEDSFGSIIPCEAEANAHLIAAAPETAAERDRLKEVNKLLAQALSYTNLDTDHEGLFCNCPLADGTRPDGDHATSCVAARQAIQAADGKGEK